jgi:hypothetical protein
MASGVSDAIGETIPRQFLRTPAAWALPLFGFAPLLLISVVASLEQTRAAFVIYFALAWTAYFFVWVADNKPSLPLGLALRCSRWASECPLGHC